MAATINVIMPWMAQYPKDLLKPAFPFLEFEYDPCQIHMKDAKAQSATGAATSKPTIRNVISCKFVINAQSA
jgi:hypothetical protein